MTKRKTYTQCEHQRINAREYPGTRQMCYECDEPTRNCEEDGLKDSKDNWLCQECFENKAIDNDQ